MRLIAFALLAVVIVAEGRNHFLNNNAFKPIVPTTPRIITKENCKPGEGYLDDCNWCTCREPGYSHVCTLMLCPSNKNKNNVNVNGIVDVSEESKTEDTSLNAEKICEPGEKFRVNCKNCACSYDGTYAFCWRMFC